MTRLTLVRKPAQELPLQASALHGDHGRVVGDA
jgi:hypothetical protein